MKRFFLPVLLCSLACGQSVAPKLAFEVASIRPGPTGTIMELARAGKIYLTIDSARVSMGSISLSEVVSRAYRLPWEQITGPDWMKDQRFDIQAKLPPGASVEQVPEMLQTLLAERFKLVIHKDQKVVPVYAMTVGKDGPKFHESVADDSDAVQCNGGVHKVCHKVTMEDLANILSLPNRVGMNTAWAVDRPVIDMTGVSGTYDFTMDYGFPGGRGSGAAGTESEVVSAFDAVKALGLKLEPTKHTYDILVIDHVERLPTEN